MSSPRKGIVFVLVMLGMDGIDPRVVRRGIVCVHIDGAWFVIFKSCLIPDTHSC